MIVQYHFNKNINFEFRTTIIVEYMILIAYFKLDSDM